MKFVDIVIDTDCQLCLQLCTDVTRPANYFKLTIWSFEVEYSSRFNIPVVHEFMSWHDVPVLDNYSTFHGL